MGNTINQWILYVYVGEIDLFKRIFKHFIFDFLVSQSQSKANEKEAIHNSSREENQTTLW